MKPTIYYDTENKGYYLQYGKIKLVIPYKSNEEKTAIKQIQKALR